MWSTIKCFPRASFTAALMTLWHTELPRESFLSDSPFTLHSFIAISQCSEATVVSQEQDRNQSLPRKACNPMVIHHAQAGWQQDPTGDAHARSLPGTTGANGAGA